MALFVVQQSTARSPADAWFRLTDWPQHGRYVPFTTITVPTAGPNRVGTVFVARTHLGSAGFDDPMEITEWQPPDDGRGGHCRLEKRGRVMTGWAELSVTVGGGSTLASWREDIHVAKLPRFADAPTALSSRLLFGRVLRRLLAA